MNKWLALAVFSMLASGVAAQQEQPGASDFRACEEAVKTNDFDGMIASCEKAVAANPDVFLSHYYLGYAYRAKKNYDKCGDNFSKFLTKLGSQDAGDMKGNATREGGVCLARGSDHRRAIPYLQKAVAAKPSDTEAQWRLGISLTRAKREAEAEPVFAKVIQLDPSIGPAYYYAGRTNFYDKEWDKADQRLRKYLELEPDGNSAADAHFMVGRMAAQKAQGQEEGSADLGDAVDHLGKFLAAKPNAPQAPEALFILGVAAAQREDNETAKVHFEKYLELKPTGEQAEEAKKFLEDLKNSAK